MTLEARFWGRNRASRGTWAARRGEKHFPLETARSTAKEGSLDYLDRGDIVAPGRHSPGAISAPHSRRGEHAFHFGIAEEDIESTEKLGFMAGEISVPDDFDSLGATEIRALFEGGSS